MSREPKSMSPWIRIPGTILITPFALVGGFVVYVLLITVLMPLGALVHLARFALDPGYRQRVTAGAGEVLYHRGHTRLVVGPEAALVGPDELASSVVGGDGWTLEAPAVGAELKAGDAIWRWRRGDRTLEQVAPICGTILEVNADLLRDLSAVARAPVADLWIVKIKPAQAVREIGGLVALDAVRRWQDAARDWIVAQSGGELGAVAADGGRLVPGFGSRLSDEQWAALVTREFRKDA